MKENKDTLVFTTLSFTFAAIGAAVISKPWEIVSITRSLDNIPVMLAFYLMLAVFTAVIPFFLYSKGLEGIKPDTASILAFSEPLTACIFGALVLHQPMDGFGIAGIILVCVAIVILNLNFKGYKRANK